MWADNDIDNAFRRLDPAEPEPTPFPLDAWLKLESQLDEAVIARAVRRRLWQFFAAEVAAVLLVALGWQLWPAGAPAAPLLAAATAAHSGQKAAAATAGAPGASATAATAATEEVRNAPAAATTSNRSQPIAKALSEPLPTDKIAALPEPRRPAAVGTPAAAVAAPSAPTAARVSARGWGSAGRQLSRSPGYSSHKAPGAEALAGRTGTAGRPAAGAPGRLATADAPGASARPTGAAPVAATSLASSAAAARRQSLTPPVAGRLTLRPAAGSAATEVALPTGTASEAAVAAAASHAPGKPLPAAAFATASASDNLNALPAVVVALAAPVPAELPAHLALVAVAPTADLPRPQRSPRLYVGLVAAPDVSTVKFDGAGKPSLNLGLTLDVRLGNRLRLSTGLLRSNKQYVARREDYDWGDYAGRVYSRNFSDVNGACTVLDVPLNLRYDLLVRPGYRLVSTVGLSSFFLQRESYNYDWTDASGAHTWSNSATNQNRHLLSILNLAAGAEWGLGTRWSLLAEPYVKVPLAGVGLGKVKLLSAGVYLGVKYGF